jgi:hypothetical protein
MTLALTELARALGGVSSDSQVAARVDGVEVELDIERDWLGRPRWTRLRAEAQDASGMARRSSRRPPASAWMRRGGVCRGQNQKIRN